MSRSPNSVYTNSEMDNRSQKIIAENNTISMLILISFQQHSTIARIAIQYIM